MSVTARRGVVRVADPARVLAHRLRCQRLDQRTQEGVLELVTAIGYLPCPGGASPYLSLWTRSPRLDRHLLELEVFDNGALLELPFARHTWVVAPATDAPWVLAAARRGHEQKAAPLRKARLIDDRKAGKIAELVLAALEEGPSGADELRTRLPQPLCVPLGEAGRKAGFPSLFTLVLRELLLDGAVIRRSRERRLDRDGALFALPDRPIPQLDRAEALAALAGRYFRAHAPAPVAGFAHFADCTMSEARAAVADAELVGVSIEEEREPFFLGPEQLAEFETFEPPSPPRLAFVPFRDPAVSALKDLRPLLAPEDRHLAFADWRGRLVPAGGGSWVHQHFILLGGLIAGIWEFDETRRQVRYATIHPLPTRMRRVADAAAQELGAFVAEELGDATFYGGERGETFGRLDEVTAAWSR